MCELNNIRIVPGLVKNIISINQLRSKGWKIEEGDEGGFNLKRNGQVLKFKRGDENNLYYMHADTVEVNTVSQLVHGKIFEKSYDEAHDQWGHHGVNRLQAMARMEGVKLVGEPTTCHACGMAKACRARVSKLTMTKAEKIGERFFVDTTGPFAGVATDCKYLFGAVDDYSGKLFMMFGARKFDLKIFVEKLLTRVKEKHGLPMYVRLDGGGENMAVRKFCNDLGIKVELTPPYTPQYNGRIERRFAVITSMAMALLWNAGFTSVMKGKLLPQALRTASFLNDLAPTVRNNKSAQELWDGKRIEFGRVGLVKIKTKITGKLNDKAEAMIMVGYGNEYPVGTYKFYNPKTKRFVFSDSVTWSKFKRWEIHPSMDGIYLKAKNMNGDGIDDNDRKTAVDLEDEEAESETKAVEVELEGNNGKVNVNLGDDGTLRQTETVEGEPERHLRRSKRLAGIPADGPSVSDGVNKVTGDTVVKTIHLDEGVGIVNETEPREVNFIFFIPQLELSV